MTSMHPGVGLPLSHGDVEEVGSEVLCIKPPPLGPRRLAGELQILSHGCEGSCAKYPDEGREDPARLVGFV